MSRVDNGEQQKLELNVNLVSNETEQSIDIRDLQNSLKKRRMMVFAVSLSAFIIGVAAALIYMLVQPASGAVSAVMTYSYKGIEEGVDPLGREMAVDKIKAPYVVDQAIKELGLDVRGITIDDVRTNFEIQGLIPKDAMQEILTIKEIATKEPNVLQDLSNITYFPTQYIITLSRAGKLRELNSNELTELLNTIYRYYSEYFLEEYADRYVYETIAENFDQMQYDYTEVVKILNGQINNMINYCEAKRKASPNFKSPVTQMTFGDIITNLELIRSVDLNRISALVYASDMSRDMNRLIKFYEYSIVYQTTEMNVALENSRAATEMALQYEKDSALVMGTLGDSMQLSQSSAVYDGFVQDALSQSQRANQLKEEIEFDKRRLAALKGEQIPIDPDNPESGYYAPFIAHATPEDIQFVENEIPRVISRMHEWADIVNQSAEDYLVLEAFKNSPGIVVPGHYESALIGNLKMMLIIVGGVTFLGLFISILAAIWGTAFPEKRLDK